ncbi:vacuolar protein sorting-associated protein 33B isoform X2 [Eurytemora carolleeae]|uniref:vacuolar protein sorting-associated protein 33B isoform X2 n=1 Tax=Eurytemora carolleeae TaxID=1294199 RepID=UPI000C76976E|nr:vacuolar protein sorting-associated protein 33B isoform X2 [Eurytemora carolleeae]|eukprot:XP_023328568.1 vacuolar protein sorting-associated protein 33B-like isoform X2 [Eurytemora affinis]
MAGLGPDMSALILLSRENLIGCLNKIPGRKQLVLEPELTRPLDRIAGMSTLSKTGVESVIKLERGPVPPMQPNLSRVYFISANLIQAKYVADQEEGISGFVTMHQFSWEFIPLDFDLLSLELPSFFRNQFLGQDHSGLVSVARALWGIQSIYGDIPNLFAHGKSVKKLLNLVNVFSLQYGQPRTKQADIGYIYIFERDIDYASCLLSPLTYEGLLDEVFGISCGTVEFPKEVTGTDTTTKLQLSSKDKMFEKIRNKHFATIFSVLGVTAKQLSAAQAAASSMNINEMKSFVQNDLKHMKTQSKAVALHIGASERIQKLKGRMLETQLPVEHTIISAENIRDSITYIEERMAQLVPANISLRLICLLSYCSDGLTQNDYTRLKTQYIQAYGFHHIITWSNLTNLGLIKIKGGELGKIGVVSQVAGLVGAQNKTTGFQGLVRKLGLVSSSENLSLSDPNTPGYVFNGAYTPVACKVVQELIKAVSLTGKTGAAGAKTSFSGTSLVTEALKFSPGETIIDMKSPGAPKLGLVLFVGGYTMAEVAAFRWLQAATGWELIIAGTGNISANHIISQCEKL